MFDERKGSALHKAELESVAVMQFRGNSTQPELKEIPTISRQSKGSYSPRNKRFHRGMVLAALFAADFFAVGLSIIAAGLLSAWLSPAVTGTPFAAFESEWLTRRLEVWTLLGSAACVWFAVTGHYTARHTLAEDMRHIVNAAFVLLMLDAFVAFADKTQFSRLWILLVWPIMVIVMMIVRVLARKILDKMGLWRMGAAVLGGGTHYASLEASLHRDRYVGYYVAYHADFKAPPSIALSPLSLSLASEMRLRNAEIAMLVPSETDMEEMGRVIDALNLAMTPFIVVPPMQRLPAAGLTIQAILSSDAVLMTSRNGLLSPIRRAAKRVIDVVVASAILLFLLPLFVVIGGIIAMGGGAPIFGHERVGSGGRPFRCLKFRSMARNADQLLRELLAKDEEAARLWHKNFKLDNDPRITRIGRFLRSSSLDELPQLINVIKGEMSLVGPRPVVAEELRRYYGDDAFYYSLVRPGMTGLWQVSGRSQTSYARRVHLDAWYVRNWSLWTDVVIFFSTVPAVLRREGAH